MLLFEEVELLSWISFKGALVLELLTALVRLFVAFNPELLNLLT